MVNRIAQLCETKTAAKEPSHFGDLRRRQPLYLPAPTCAVSSLLATEFLDLLRASISLNLLEKFQVLQHLSHLSKDEIECLIEIMRAEQDVFRNLSDIHQRDLRNLESKAITDWWRVECWFWQQGHFEFEPMLFIAKADSKLPPNVEFLLQQMNWA